MRYLVAVSGGVDSVVLLDKLVKEKTYELIVAHFDHGIRPDSAGDARFVEALAAKYKLPFVGAREELGPKASEELARRRRYAFLRGQAAEHHAVIATAHHADDVVETVAINLTRGTGWRGLAVLSAEDIERPLIHLSKQEIREYATANRLEWVEDATNAQDTYLRNRVRRQAGRLLGPKDTEKIMALRKHQVVLKQEVAQEAARLAKDHEGSRYFLTQIDTGSACELLRQMLPGASLTRPQLERALLMIKTARPGSTYEAGAGVSLHFTTQTFTVKTVKSL